MENENEFRAFRLSSLIRKYQEGELSMAEEIELQNWRATSPKNETLFKELTQDQYVSQQISNLKDYDTERALQKLSERIGLNKSKTTVVHRLYLRIAAVAASIILLSLLYVSRTQLNNWLHPVQYERLITQAGERKIFTLADGTKIWLGPATTLDYPNRFNGNTREIKLSGEAFFDVHKDHIHPFIIHSGKIATTVLGTSFDLKAYADEKKITVTLLTGKVSFSDGNKKTVLLPNQRAVYQKDNEQITRENYPDAKDMLARRTGDFRYEGTAVMEIIADLQREYNVNIRVDGDISNCTFYGDKKPDDDVLNFLKKVCLSINAQIRHDRNTIIITAPGC